MEVKKQHWCLNGRHGLNSKYEHNISISADKEKNKDVLLYDVNLNRGELTSYPVYFTG